MQPQSSVMNVSTRDLRMASYIVSVISSALFNSLVESSTVILFRGLSRFGSIEKRTGVNDLEDKLTGRVVLFCDSSHDLVYGDFVVVFESATSGVADKFSCHVCREFILTR